MSNNSFNLSTEVNLEKFYAAQRSVKQNQSGEQQKETIVKEDPNTTGIQWAYTQAPAATQASQALNQADIQQKQGNAKGVDVKSKGPEVIAPDIEDAAILSTQVAIKEDEVNSPIQKGLNQILASQFNLEALEQSYREHFKKSKSHNLLVARFMAHCKFSSLKMLLSLLGVSAEEQIKMQEEVRTEALKEIDTKLSQDWAYTKAMIEITG